MRTGIDVLVMEDCILYKKEQPDVPDTIKDWKTEYALD